MNYAHHFVSEVVSRTGGDYAMIDGGNNSGTLGYPIYTHAVITGLSTYGAYEAAFKNISTASVKVYSYNIVAIGM